MSKLDKLICELCPNGVEYRALGDVCKLITGATPSKKLSSYWNDGTIPWMSSGEVSLKRVWSTEAKITQLAYDKTSTTLVPPHSIVIALAGQGKTRGKVAITEIELCTNQSLCSIVCSNELDYKFLYYYLDGKYEELRSISNGDGSRGGLSLKILSPYKIPVPPLDVQREIVRILDNFTELTAELTAELIARKKQYEYYRDKLLALDVFKGRASKCNVRTFRIDELCNISRGKVISKDYIKEHPGHYPVYSSQTENDGVLGCISEYAYDGEFITWTTDGANAETVFFRNGKFSITNVCGLLSPKNGDLNLRYLYYVLSKDARQYVNKGMGNAKLMSNVMGGIKIAVPPLSIQNRIANVLDNFDAICSDLNMGLPAEIEARQKQYEYYRDKLLTFKERISI